MATRWRRAVAWSIGILILLVTQMLLVLLLMNATSISSVTIGVDSTLSGHWRPYLVVWPPQNGTMLQRIRQRGYLICGVGNGLPGFGELRSENPPEDLYSSGNGFDIDFCKAIAVAVFSDETKVKFKPLTAKNRFPALKNGEIDVLLRITTCTAGRNIDLGFECGPVIFHDSQKFLSAENSKIDDISKLQGKEICVIGSTTNASSLTLLLQRVSNITANPVSIDDSGLTDEQVNEKLVSNFKDGHCEVIAGDKTRLIGVQNILNNVPISSTMIPRDADPQIAYEPLTPLILTGDKQWRDIVSYAIYAPIYAAEHNLKSEDVGDCKDIPRQATHNWFLGIDTRNPYFGQNFQLDQGFACRIIQKIGNYDQIYERNLVKYLGKRTLADPNQVWQPSNSGRLYSPPLTPP